MAKYIVSETAVLPISMVLNGQNVLFEQGQEIPLGEHRTIEQIRLLIDMGYVREVPDSYVVPALDDEEN